MESASRIKITVNGTEYTVLNPDPKIHLNEWLRNHLHLTGTKALCHEGGCGSCVVAVAKEDPMTSPGSIKAVNSCLQPLMSLDGCHIVTVEGLGGKKDGFHVIQKRFAKNFASQCGYCTPGFVMSGFSLLASDTKSKTCKEIEEGVDGNICRCTGYRPILDALKSFAVDSDPVDIEDLRKYKNCMKTCKIAKPQIIDHSTDIKSGASWFKPTSLADFFQVVKQLQGKQTKFVAGNTISGLYKDKHTVDAFVHLSAIEGLVDIKVEKNSVNFGSGITITKMIEFLEAASDKSTSFIPLAKHLSKIANVPVRNVATWAGSLMLKHIDGSFPSDMFILFETVEATIKIVDMDGCTKEYSPRDFLESDMKSKLILSCTIPFSKEDVIIRTYKIMSRNQSTYAHVNAGFKATVDQTNGALKTRPTIVFGGLGLNLARASKLEEFLTGKCLDNDLFQDAVKILESNLEEYRGYQFIDSNYCKHVAVNLFYKFCLAMRGANVCKQSLSAIDESDRAVSSGKQVFNVSKDAAPVNQPIQRIKAELLASGEVEFVGDLPKYQTEVYASLVLSTKGLATLKNISSTEASKHPGFVAMFTAKDIPGENNWVTPPYKEEIVVSKNVEFFGQPVAIVIGDSQKHADEIAKLVQVDYSDERKPVTSLKEAVEKKQFFPKRFPDLKSGDTEEAFKSCDHIIVGEITTGGQHHFYMEPQTCLVVPEQNGYKIFSATQCTRLVQEAVSRALAVNASSVDVEVPRVGGAFGGKTSYPARFAAAATVAANALSKPVRMTMSLGDILQTVGKRSPCLFKYKVGFSKNGCLESCEIQVYCGVGIVNASLEGLLAAFYADTAYFSPNWNISITDCKMNTPHNTFMRAPGIMSGIFMMESILEHIASFLGVANPDDIREVNMYRDKQLSLTGSPVQGAFLRGLYDKMKMKSDYEQRRSEIAIFNKANRWKKRGISMMPLKYHVSYMDFCFSVLVSIYYSDGTVAVSHGGVEIGQGINTRICQVTAAKLGIPMELITIKTMSTVTSPNSFETGASITSEMNCLAVQKCCEILLERMEPVRQKFPEADWKQLIHECGKAKVDLSENYMYFNPDKKFHSYFTYGAACSEAEIDILTGEHQLLRSDIMYDCGESINQSIDIGQLEGAFVMGIGAYFTERVQYHEDTGEPLLTNTWSYVAPTSKDIPIDLRVELVQDLPNPIKHVRSKAVGEPSICMASTCFFAVKRAIEAARAELDIPAGYFQLDYPATIEKIQNTCLVEPRHLVL